MLPFYENFWKKQGTTQMPDFSYKWPVISKYIPTKPDLSILDFGCGHGQVMTEMSKINPTSTYAGIDVSRKAIKLASKLHPKSKFYVASDGARFPVRSNTYDFVLASDVIEHIFYTQQALSELTRVLKPGGKILISTPYHGVIKNIALSIYGFEKVFDPTEAHIRFFTKKSLYGMLTKAGLTIEKYGHFGRFFPLSRGMFVVCSKPRSYRKSMAGAK